ncbi:GDP-mannose 4,6-dehydratase [Brachyspira aalborgi]|uniref:GDP-mannose 4,6-dehydratase n=1 Tax=Brachyspira aalborgi TaxID=29522 RepID=UPI0024116EC8|nr:NAD-dependent epimerase/dehydratase family protein [Brachyspira aalborgi]
MGSHTALNLIEKTDYKIIIFDNLENGHNKIIFEKGDLRNIEDIENVFNKYSIDGVIHFAAFALVEESVQNPSKYYRNNIYGTLNLLDTMIKHNVKRIVFSSTCATYGDIVEQTPIDEKHPQNPTNPYGYSKLSVERIMDDYDKAYKLKIKDEIKSNFMYDNLIKYCIELFNEEKLRKSQYNYNKRITKILEVTIDAIFEDIERLKFILDIYFPKNEKELNKIYEYIEYEEKYKLDIPIYCLSKKKIDRKNILKLTDGQRKLIIKYLTLYVRKDKHNEIKIIVKNILDEYIDLSIYWDLIRNQFLEYCNNYDIKQHGLFFLDRYRNLLEVINPTKEEFEKFSEAAKNFFYWYIIKEDNKELYLLIPKEIKKAI